MPAQPIKYKPLVGAQRGFRDSRKKFAGFFGGFGSGKTYSLCMKAFQLMSENQKLPGGLVAPSYKMYKRDVVPTIREICMENGIRFKYNKTDFVWSFPQANALMYCFSGEDDGQSIKGPNLAP